jgi:hypothetical protein
VRSPECGARETAAMSRYDSDTDEAVLTESETRLKKPPLYQVLLHNDDFTTMEFVVYVLQNVFQRSETEAVRVMLRFIWKASAWRALHLRDRRDESGEGGAPRTDARVSSALHDRRKQRLEVRD